jgi:hypothetical protein
MTVGDLVATQRFRDNLAAYMEAQKTDRQAIRESYEAMRKMGGAKGYKLPAHPIDRVINMSVDEFAGEYMKIVARVSKRPVAERQYIAQLGGQAYSLTVAQIVCEEFPELENELIPKTNNN